jgi:hypothetical protein
MFIYPVNNITDTLKMSRQKNQFETTTEKFERAVNQLVLAKYPRKKAINLLIKNLREKDEFLANYALSYFHGKEEI